MTKNKIILVLGGTGDIGSAISGRLEKDGFAVLRHGLSGDYVADVRDSEQTKKMLDKIMEKFGRIDGVVNTVSAPADHGGIEKKTWDNFSNHLNIQLKSAVDTAHWLVPVMKKQGGGALINILTSYVAEEPPSGLSDYVSAKYAMLGLTKALAQELGKYKITVNAISPSFIKNRFTKHIPEKMIEMIIDETPSGRLTTAEDVAAAASFLLSEKSS